MIKTKPIDVNLSTYTDFVVENNDKYLKFKLGDHVRILRFKSIFRKSYTPSWSEEVFVIKKVKKTVSWRYVIEDLNGVEIVGSFYEKELQKTNQTKLRIKKVIKKKGAKLYVK